MAGNLELSWANSSANPTTQRIYRKIDNGVETLLTSVAPGTTTYVDEGVIDLATTKVDYRVESVGIYRGVETLRSTPVQSFEIIALAATITNSADNLKVGQSIDLTYSLNKDITPTTAVWSSTNNSIATVDQNGRVTSLQAGQVTIKLVINGTTEATQVVNMVIADRSVIEEPTVDFHPGETHQLVGTVLDYNDVPVTLTSQNWSSSDSTVATVDQTGLVTVLKDGSTTISFAGNDRPATVYELSIGVVELAITNAPAELLVTFDQTLGYTLTPNFTPNKVYWESLNSTIASVNQGGKLSAHNEGTATIKLTINDTIFATIEVIVKMPVVTVTAAKMDPIIGETVQLDRSIEPAITITKTEWQALTASIGTISTSGLVTAVAAGQARFRCIVNSVFTKEITLNVSDVAVQMTGSLDTLAPNGTTQLGYTTTPEITPTSVIWTSGTPAVATVTQAGLVTAVSEGTSEITVNINNRFTAKSTITVEANNSIVMTTPTVSVNMFETAQLAYNRLPTDFEVTSEVWSGTNEFFSVSEAGLVTGLKAGTGLITVLVNGSLEATADVTIEEVLVDIVGPDTLTYYGTGTLTLEVEPALTNPTITWSVDDDTVLTLNAETGEYEVVGVGDITVTATVNGIVAATHAISTAPVITVDAHSGYVEYGLTNEISVYYNPEIVPTSAVWSVDNESVATIDQNGVLTGTGIGDVNVTLRVNDKWESTVLVSGVIAITVEGPTQVEVGASIQLNAITNPPTTLTRNDWSSSNDAFATVDQTGLVTGVSPGAIWVQFLTDDYRGAGIEVEVVATA